MSREVPRRTVLGLDYYEWNEKLIDRQGHTEALGELFGWYVIADQYWRRYRRTMMHTETNRTDAGDAPRWLWRQWHNVQLLRSAGRPIIGFTWYSLTDQIDWDRAIKDSFGVDFPGRIVRSQPRPARGWPVIQAADRHAPRRPRISRLQGAQGDAELMSGFSECARFRPRADSTPPGCGCDIRSHRQHSGDRDSFRLRVAQRGGAHPRSFGRVDGRRGLAGDGARGCNLCASVRPGGEQRARRMAVRDGVRFCAMGGGGGDGVAACERWQSARVARPRSACSCPSPRGARFWAWFTLSSIARSTRASRPRQSGRKWDQVPPRHRAERTRTSGARPRLEPPRPRPPLSDPRPDRAAPTGNSHHRAFGRSGRKPRSGGRSAC